MKNIFKMMGIALVACTMFVACGDDEKTDAETFTITVKANDDAMGTVTGGGKYESGATATLTATANAGYKFVSWSDGSTNNPLLVTVTKDETYTATFAAEQGIKVQFGDATWNAEYINAQTNLSAYMIAASQSTSTTYPFALIFSSSMATGTTSSTCNIDLATSSASTGDPYMWLYDEQPVFNLDGDGAGSWWADNLTVNVTAVDADALTISFVANGTALHVTELFDGATWSNLTSKAMTMTATNVQLTSVKGLKAAKSGKIARM